jgi:crossover junction endodeoxyribonuclease RuvC
MQPGAVLTLDLASRLGWAAGVPGDRPSYGVVQLRGAAHGEIYAALGNWLDDARKVHQPRAIIFEAPLVSGQHAGMNAARMAFGMVAIVEQFCWDHSIQVMEEHVGRTRKAMIGRGNFPKGTAKTEVLRWLNAQGFSVTDDNAGDALLLWKHVETIRLGRQMPAPGMFAGSAA